MFDTSPDSLLAVRLLENDVGKSKSPRLNLTFSLKVLFVFTLKASQLVVRVLSAELPPFDSVFGLGLDRQTQPVDRRART